MIKTSKDFANIILVVVIVVIAGAVGYFAVRKSGLTVHQPPTSTFVPIPKDETVSWKTFTNSQYGFVVRYPADWQSVVSNNIGGDIVFLTR